MKKAAKSRIVTLLAAVAVTIVSFLPASIMAHPGSGIAVDRQGQVYFLDTGSGLWRIDTQGRATRLSETLFHALVNLLGCIMRHHLMPVRSARRDLNDVLATPNNPTAQSLE
jgi:hypothetical protein